MPSVYISARGAHGANSDSARDSFSSAGGATGQIAQVLREKIDAVAGWHVERVCEHAEHGAGGAAPYSPRRASVAEALGRIASQDDA